MKNEPPHPHGQALALTSVLTFQFRPPRKAAPLDEEARNRRLLVNTPNRLTQQPRHRQHHDLLALLTGRTQSELIRALVGVAHPDFRPWLKRAAWREYRVSA